MSPIQPTLVGPAARYSRAGDLAVVTCYFNSHGYRSKRRNYDDFERSILDSGLRLLTAEVAFADAEFELPAAPHILRLRARDVLWHKERLLNIAIAQLPPEITKVAWLDGDILFENADWAVETSRALESVPVLQPFHHAFRLLPGQRAHDGQGERHRSFAAVHNALPGLSRFASFTAHGHTGFAWAARRDVVRKLGLYDAAIAGSGDHLMAHAFCGDFSSRCLEETFLQCSSYLEHFKQWAEPAWRLVRGQIGLVPGAVLHLWHGERKFRGHRQRNEAMSRLGFDPLRDLHREENGLWCWSDRMPGLRDWGLEYFAHRQEDLLEGENDAGPI